MTRTSNLRQDSQLFIASHKPHKAVSTSTISRWIKSCLKASGIDTDKYKAHSTRAASSSAATASLDISQILRAGSWSRTSTFGKYYNKPIEDTTKFGLTILERK